MSQDIIVHQPADSDGKPTHQSLTQEGFPAEDFQGQWYVVRSTLSMWKKRKDVTITYTPHTASPFRLNDNVKFRSAKSPSSKEPTSILGISSLLTPPSEPTAHGAHFKWRGTGLLGIASSKWQVLGYNLNQGWAVTYFEKTIFTPAGLDIYARDEKGLGDAAEEMIVEKIKALGGEVGKLAQDFFVVKRGD